MKVLIRGVVILIIATMLFGCFPPGPATMFERIARFQDAVNSAGSNLQEHFHPDLTSSYAQIADDTVFTSGPLAFSNGPFSFTNPVESPSETLTYNFENGFGVTGSIVFVMALYGDDYRIRSFILTIDTTDYEISRFGVGL